MLLASDLKYGAGSAYSAYMVTTPLLDTCAQMCCARVWVFI